MNMFFDLFNTREGRNREPRGPAQQPFGQDLQKQLEVLDTVYEMTSQMRKKGSTSESARLPFQDGILRNCKALPLLLQDLRDMFPEEKNLVIHTQTLNQDILESFFSVIRAFGATFTAPDPLQFRYRLRRYLATRFPETILSGSSTNVFTAMDLETLSAQVRCCYFKNWCN